MKFTIPTIVFGALITAPVLAQETRSADAHEHGHGTFNMAVEGKTVSIELETPAFDLLGFEYEAKSETEIAAVETALTALVDPVTLFGLGNGAACSVTDTDINIGADHGEDHHDDDHHDDEHHGDDHAEDKHDDEHADAKHDDHDKHDDDHADHGDEKSEHSEVHAQYTLTCAAPEKITGINMTAYFAAFPNAEELDAAILTDAGQASGELEPESPELSF